MDTRAGQIYQQLVSSFDDVNEKLIFNLGISYDKEYQVVSNGLLKEKTTKETKFLAISNAETDEFLFANARNWKI